MFPRTRSNAMVNAVLLGEICRNRLVVNSKTRKSTASEGRIGAHPNAPSCISCTAADEHWHTSNSTSSMAGSGQRIAIKPKGGDIQEKWTMATLRVFLEQSQVDEGAGRPSKSRSDFVSCSRLA